MTPRVFVTQENPQLNYVPAEEFGTVKFMTRDDFSPMRNSLSNKRLQQQLEAAVKMFDPTHDFIVLSGSPIVSAYVFMVIGRIYPGRVIKLLRWSNRDRVYQPIEINPNYAE